MRPPKPGRLWANRRRGASPRIWATSAPTTGSGSAITSRRAPASTRLPINHCATSRPSKPLRAMDVAQSPRGPARGIRQAGAGPDPLTNPVDDAERLGRSRLWAHLVSDTLIKGTAEGPLTTESAVANPRRQPLRRDRRVARPHHFRRFSSRGSPHDCASPARCWTARASRPASPTTQRR